MRDLSLVQLRAAANVQIGDSATTAAGVPLLAGHLPKVVLQCDCVRARSKCGPLTRQGSLWIFNSRTPIFNT
jgi:hypothetical protein